MSDPHATPDTGCLKDLLPPFAADPEVDAQFFGGLPLWDNPELNAALQLLAASGNLTGIDARAFVVRPLAPPAPSLR